MFNKRLLIAIKTVLASAGKLLKTPTLDPERLPGSFSGVGPKKGMMSYHRDIRKQKLSRYPTAHQGARECARRIK